MYNSHIRPDLRSSVRVPISDRHVISFSVNRPRFREYLTGATSELINDVSCIDQRFNLEQFIDIKLLGVEGNTEQWLSLTKPIAFRQNGKDVWAVIVSREDKINNVHSPSMSQNPEGDQRNGQHIGVADGSVTECSSLDLPTLQNCIRASDGLSIGTRASILPVDSSAFVPIIKSNIRAEYTDFVPIMSNLLAEHTDFVPIMSNLRAESPEFVPIMSNLLAEHTDFVPIMSNLLAEHTDFVPIMSNLLAEHTDFVPIMSNLRAESPEFVPTIMSSRRVESIDFVSTIISNLRAESPEFVPRDRSSASPESPDLASLATNIPPTESPALVPLDLCELQETTPEYENKITMQSNKQESIQQLSALASPHEKISTTSTEQLNHCVSRTSPRIYSMARLNNEHQRSSRRQHLLSKSRVVFLRKLLVKTQV